MSTLRTFAALLVVPSLLVFACSSTTTVAGPNGSGEPDAGTTTDDGSATEPRDCGDTPKSQAVSQPCCLGHGVDACGAGLFCGAFDGRTQATCYPERSRKDQSECNADVECTSGECNVGVHKCKSTPSLACASDVGCAKDPQDRVYVCAASSSEKATCQRVGDGSGGTTCAVNADCKSGSCRVSDHVCLASKGERCDFGECHCSGACGYECQAGGCPVNNCATGSCTLGCGNFGGAFCE